MFNKKLGMFNTCDCGCKIGKTSLMCQVCSNKIKWEIRKQNEIFNN